MICDPDLPDEAYDECGREQSRDFTTSTGSVRTGRRRLDWFGFVSNATESTALYLDDLTLALE